MLTVDDPDPPSVPYRYVSPRQYLVRERAAEYKTEYNDGELVAMAGVSRRHSLIATALMVSLVNQLRGRGCEVHGSDLRVKADEGRRYVYPDVTVVCGKPKLEGKGPDVLTNPTVVFEILSGSTEQNDRGWKLDAYRRMPSVGEVVLLSQNEPAAEVYRRGPDGGWEALLPLRGIHALLRLDSIDCAVPLADVYAGLSPAYAR
ncbi:MAG: Uma2 family endonuclease [Longimicrobiaceae bacterium]